MSETVGLNGSSLLNTILETEEKLCKAADWEDMSLFFEFLYRTALLIGKTDAFYICIYDKVNDTVFFPYNREGDDWDVSEIKPLTGGPTTWAIRNKQTLVLNEATASIQHGGQNFGDLARQSKSALHSPMVTYDISGNEVLIGVISMQSYEIGVYTSETKRGIEWLAATAARVIQRNRDINMVRRLSEQKMTGDEEIARILGIQANQFTRALQDLTKHAEQVLKEVREGDVTMGIKTAISNLCKACHRAQVSSIMDTFDIGLADHDAADQPGVDDPFVKLTKAERQVLVCIATHYSNVEIASLLNKSKYTVARQVSDILGKLNIKSRVEAAKLAIPYLNAYKNLVIE